MCGVEPDGECLQEANTLGSEDPTSNLGIGRVVVLNGPELSQPSARRHFSTKLKTKLAERRSSRLSFCVKTSKCASANASGCIDAGRAGEVEETDVLAVMVSLSVFIASSTDSTANISLAKEQ